MEYSELVGVYERLAATTKRLEKTEILSGFLQKIPADEFEKVILLLEGKVFSQQDKRKIGFSSRLMLKAISLAAGVSAEGVERKAAKVGDLGRVAESVLREKQQHTLARKHLDVEKVFGNIRKLAEMEGEGTVGRKIGLVVELLSHAQPLEARYIVNTVLENLRVGIAEGLIRDGLAAAFQVDVHELEKVAGLRGGYAEISGFVREGKLKGLGLKVGKPVKCELALTADSVGEGFEALGRPAQFEVKMDGFRLQCHFDGSKYWLYTRRMELVNTQFPDVIEILKKGVKARSFILDAETVGWDVSTGKYLPFQMMSQRIKRKYDIHEVAEKYPVELDVFDVLYCDGENLMEAPFAERRKLLEKIVREKKHQLVLTRKLVTDDARKAEGFFQKALHEGYEGVMVKNLKAAYQPGRYVGGWMKIKSILQPLDLVVVKAEYGEGKRAGWLTSFTLACRHGKELLEVGKVSTGVKEKAEGLTYKEMTAMLKPLILEQKGKEVVVKPKIVLEVAYEEIQKSPSYSSGYALRFPRVLRSRVEEKGVEDINTLKNVEKIYSSQRGKK